ncbi:GGDEF domain-containing protein [Sphingomonas bacterium]|uniref:GGDEF domain-containing protein n=1 Tax=Sphingomonas bacterium TaxID=1895847 RepID=UPI0015763CDF|nr:GGDEF domain-containing protein [Sphingomonas bacterium]
MAIFDLDHFKSINDGFGHAVGDEVLKNFAQVAGAQIRAGDMLARIGGEKFGLLFPRATPAQAHGACERIREALAGASVKASDWPVRVTVSVGISGLEDADTTQTVMRSADRALYAAKDQGRNRSSLAA